MHTVYAKPRKDPCFLGQRASSPRASRGGELDLVQRDAQHVVEVYRRRALDHPQKLAYVFLGEGAERRQRTYGEMDRWARAIAARLQQDDLAGERALLVFEPGLDYVAALTGCLYAGVTAVPAYPPDPMRAQRTLGRLQRIVQDCQARVLLTTSDVAGRIRGMLPNLPSVHYLFQIDEIELSAAEAWSPPEIRESALALVQYTSGSTGTPKGVMVSHANLLANLAQIHQKVDRPDNVCVSWLPAYHDMGLICILQLWYSCRPLILMSPLAFFSRPIRWLQAITDFRATVSPSPNFGYDLCVKKIDPADRRSLDLSSWTRALNGAEPLRPETLARFCEAYAPYGMRREAFFAAYGMAETTLMIAGSEPLAGPLTKSFASAALQRGRAVAQDKHESGTRTLISCGRPVVDLRLIIVDPETRRRLPEDRVGEIWVAGPNVGVGYWGDAAGTAATFRAYTDDGDGPFLRTGDLGFLREGELFITGRRKELIIFCGRNHYPQDIERTVEQCHAELKPYGGAVFAVDNGRRENVVIVHEVARPKRVDLPSLLETIRRRVGEEHQIPIDDIVLIRQGSLPKTSSGKTQRMACRDLYLAGQLPIVAQSRSARREAEAGDPTCATGTTGAKGETRRSTPPRTATELLLASIWKEVLGIAEVGIHDDFFDLGGNSLLATQLVSRLAGAHGNRVTLSVFFQQPTIAGVAAALDAAPSAPLASDATRRESRSAPPPLKRGDRTPGGARLSFAQQRLWFLDRLEPGNPRHNVSAAVRLEGRLDGQVLERCFREIIRRHETLRTNFVTVAGQPQARVAAEREWSLRTDDLRDLPVERQQAEVRRIAESDANTPFDLEHDDLVRARLLRLADAQHVLVLTLHHIVCDGWSMGVLRRELAALYESFAAGAPSPLGELPLQYQDYADWQRAWFDDGALAEQREYWRRQLADLPTSLELPLDRPRPAVQTYRGRSLRRRLPHPLLQSLVAIGRSEHATLFMTLLAAWQTLLSRVTGQKDIAVGSPIANRRLAQFEPLIGFFANTLVLRTDLTGAPTFRQLLGRVRETTLRAYEHQDFPFDKLVDDLAPRRDLSRSPLFQVMFVLQNAGGRPADADGLRIVDIDLGHTRTAAFDLTLNVDERPDGLDLLTVFNSDLFDDATIERLMRCFEVLLEEIVRSPDRTIAGIPIMSASDLAQLDSWHGQEPADRLGDLVPRRIASRATETPQAPAVVFRGQQLTYRELDEQSNRLAHFLRTLDLPPESLVGVFLDRSPRVISVLLAIWKAGAAYLPLDPDYPASRLAYMLEDSGAAVVITESHLLDRLPAPAPRTICLDIERESIGRQPAHRPGRPADAQALAYVLYTSGSTGRPKGVEVTHGALANHAACLAGKQDLRPTDRVLQFLSLNFDASAEEIFPTLTAGAALVLHPSPAMTSGRELLEFARANGVTVVHLPSPVSLHVLDAIADEGPAGGGHPRVFLTGGDALPPEKLRAWCATMGDRARFLFCYGATEATITSTVYEAPARESDAPVARVPIGRPIAGQRVYVLDERLQPVPPGVRGEMFLGGVGVARGYRRHPEWTSQRFLPDPFSAEPGARMYRSGDLGRFLPDGQLEFLGRVDQQAKINGFRVEPGEVESVLREHAGVREVLAVIREDADRRKLLVAYYVPRDGQQVTPAELRGWLKGRCPDYLIPALFAPLESLPTLAGGKIDRASLPDLSAIRSAAAVGRVAPRSEVEERLAAIWSDLLRVDRIGADDNFFQLGGDSILSIQMVSRAQAAGVAITAKDVFLHQTLAELAAAARPGAVARRTTDPAEGPLPLAPVQRLFFAHGLPDPRHFNQAVVVNVAADWSPDTIRKGLELLVSHHDALRLRGHREAEVWRQWIAAASGPVLLDVSSDSAGSPAEREAVLEEAAHRLQRQLDLAEGPIIRCAFFRGDAGAPARLAMVVHHFAVDAVSWRILLEDLQLACAAIHAGRTPALPPKSSSVRDWATRLAQYAESPAVRGEMAYWLAVNTSDSGRVPRDFPTGDNTVGHSQTIRRVLSPEETRGIIRDVPNACHMRAHEVLLSALAQVVTAWTGRSRVRIDVESHGREPLFDDVDVSRTVGWFTSVFPAVLSAPLSNNSEDLLRLNKEQLRRVPHNGIGYGALRWLSSDPAIRARLAAASAAEISFNYLGDLGSPDTDTGPLTLHRGGVGAMRSPRHSRPHVVEFLGQVRDERLSLDIVHSSALHRRETMERLANELVNALRALAADCGRPDAGFHSAADFPWAQVDDAELSALSALLQ